MRPVQSYSTSQNTALFFLRLVIAAIFFVAAWNKIDLWKGAPEGMSPNMFLIMKIISIAEPLGALAVLIGFLTRLAAGGLSIIMIGAILILQFQYHVGFVMPTAAGWNMPLACLGGTIILMAFGAGDWSVDAGRRR